MSRSKGWCYTLGPLDNVTLPRGLVRSIRNRLSQEPAVFHLAMAGDAVPRHW